MEWTDKIGRIGELKDALSEKGIACAMENFRVPSCPQISRSIGCLFSAAGLFLLSAGYAFPSFFTGLAGALVLLLDDCGFSPFDWLGPRERRSVLVVQGTFSGKNSPALFLAVPLLCRLTGRGYFSGKAAFRRAAAAAGAVLSFSVPILAGATALLYISPEPAALIPPGAALAALSAAAWIFPEPVPEDRNLAVEWSDRLLDADGAGFKPFLLVYSGDVAEVKFFLAKYRHPLFRGHGVFVEFAENARGPFAASEREGGFLLPYRVTPALLSLVRETAGGCGIPPLRTHVLKVKSGGLAAISRGFSAVTVFREEDPSEGGGSVPAENVVSWVREIVRRSEPAGTPGHPASE